MSEVVLLNVIVFVTTKLRSRSNWLWCVRIYVSVE